MISKIITGTAIGALISFGLVLVGAQSSSTTTSLSPSAQAVSTYVGQVNVRQAATISYNAYGFSPYQTTVRSGQAVTFRNNSSRNIQVYSNPAPAHTDDPDLNIGTIAPG